LVNHGQLTSLSKKDKYNFFEIKTYLTGTWQNSVKLNAYFAKAGHVDDVLPFVEG
jgi:hypothetical protein